LELGSEDAGETGAWLPTSLPVPKLLGPDWGVPRTDASNWDSVAGSVSSGSLFCGEALASFQAMEK